MKSLLFFLCLLTSFGAMATPKLYFVVEFEGDATNKVLNTFMYCGEAGDFAAEDYCYQVRFNKENYKLKPTPNGSSYGHLYYKNSKLANLVDDALELSLGPDGIGYMMPVNFYSGFTFTAEAKYEWIFNRDANGVPRWPLFKKVRDGFEFVLEKNKAEIENSRVHGGFYRIY